MDAGATPPSDASPVQGLAEEPSISSSNSQELSANDGGGTAPGGRKSSWRKARQVVHAVRASNSFKTLRDLVGDSYISRKQLTTIRTLGSGAFAEVTLAKMITSTPPREVAVKALHAELLKDPEEVQLFLKEVKLLRKLRHPAIVEFIGCGTENDADADLPAPGSIFFVSEVLPGGSLLDKVRTQMANPFKRVYTDADALRWCINIASGLLYLHGRRPAVIHRDLKLDNVMLTDVKASLAAAKVADFGLARLVSASTPSQQAKLATVLTRPKEQWDDKLKRIGSKMTDSQLNRIITTKRVGSKRFGRGAEGPSPAAVESYEELTGQAGSYCYMAPEVLQSQAYDDKADIFSFGMVMYCLFARTIPALQVVMHGDDDDMIIYAYKVASGYRPPIPPTVPKPVAEVIEACWKGAPALRPDAQDLVRMLQEVHDAGVVGTGEGDESGQGCQCTIC